MAKHRRELPGESTEELTSTETASAPDSIRHQRPSRKTLLVVAVIAAVLMLSAAVASVDFSSLQLKPASFTDEGECASEALLELSPADGALEAQASTREGAVCPETRLEVRTTGDASALTEWAYGVEGLHYDAEANLCSWDGLNENVPCRSADDEFTAKVVRGAMLENGELTVPGAEGQWTGILSSRSQSMLELPMELDESRAVKLAD